MDGSKRNFRQPIAKNGLYEGFKREQREKEHEKRLREFVDSVDKESESVFGGMGPSPTEELCEAIREFALPKIEESRRPVQVQNSSLVLLRPPGDTPPSLFANLLTNIPSPSGPKPDASTNSHPSRKRLNYRSNVKRAIQTELTKNPSATDIAICRAFDGDGSVELPEGWQPTSGDREFEKAYKDKRIKPKIEKIISKVRADMREAQLLPLR